MSLNSVMSSAARFTSLALLAMILVLLVPGEASACSCMPVTTAEMVASSDVVFVGREIGRSGAEGGQGGFTSQVVTFEVIEAYKGDVSPEMVLTTGSGGGDCGVGPQTGLIGIAASAHDGSLSYNICGSLHDPAAVAAILDPIEISQPTTAAPPVDSGSGIGPAIWLGAVAGALLLIGFGVKRARQDEWHDGWSADGSGD